MDGRRLIFRLLGVGLCLAGAWSVTYGLERATHRLGLSYVSGGAGLSEQDELYQERNSYNLWLTTAAKGSGAYLADVQVRIVDRRTQQPVLVHTLDGPWLFVELPAGRYDMEASYRESPAHALQTLKRTLTLQHGSHRQLVLRFDASDPGRFGREGAESSSPYNDK